MVQAVALKTLHIGRKPGKLSADGKAVVAAAEVEVVPAGRIVDLGKAQFAELAALDAVRAATRLDKALAEEAGIGEGDEGEPDLDAMTREEIDAFAAERRIDVSKADNKDEAIALIKAAG